MAKKTPQLTFTFENPNTPKSFEQMLKVLLLEKLLSWQAETARP